MSNATYIRYWNEVNDDLQQQLEYESPQDSVLMPKDKVSSFQHIATIYVKYIQIYKKIEQTYDQILQPQKRRVIREILLAVIGRLLEAKHKMVELESSDFFVLNDILLDLKLVPEDLIIPVPKFFMEDREKQLEINKSILAACNAKSLDIDKSTQYFMDLSMTDAIKIFQINERGRQGYIRAKYMDDLKKQAKREEEMENNMDEMDVGEAALKIQKIYRGYLERNNYYDVKSKDHQFLAMMHKHLKNPDENPIVIDQKNRERRKVLQKQYEEDYQQALVDIKEKIRKVEGSDMKETLQDNFRQWYMEYKRVFGKFPEFPADKTWQQPDYRFNEPIVVPETENATEENDKGKKGKGGTKKKKEKDEENEENKGDAAASNADVKKSESSINKPDAGTDSAANAQDGGAKKAAAGAKKGKKGKKAEEEVDPEEWKTDKNSKYIPLIKTCCDIYEQDWKNKNEKNNFEQRHDSEIIKNDKRKEVESEIKVRVVEILKEELKNLKLALESGKGKKKKGKKGKKGKGKKGKKGKKKEKDLTAGRTIESLYEELTQAGIIQSPVELHLNNFVCDYNILENKMDKQIVEPCLLDLHQILTEYCILPLGFDSVSDAIPKINSILLFGPKGVGKNAYVNAIATETGATLFNLSPRNTMGQYPGKAGVVKMLHMVFKVAEACQPAIICINEAEMVFAKKVPKDNPSDPKRIKKGLIKYAKKLKGKILLIGTSHKPWDCDTKGLLGLFKKSIMIPKPDYNTRYLLWKHYIKYFGGEWSTFRFVNLSLLTKLTDKFPAGAIKALCERVITEKRITTNKMKPLTTNEFIMQLAEMIPINKDDDKLYKNFFDKLPIQKKRLAFFTEGEEDPKNKKYAKGGKDAKAKKGKKK